MTLYHPAQTDMNTASPKAASPQVAIPIVAIIAPRDESFHAMQLMEEGRTSQSPWPAHLRSQATRPGQCLPEHCGDQSSPLRSPSHSKSPATSSHVRTLLLVLSLLCAATSHAADANHDAMDDGWQTLHNIAAFSGGADPDNDGRPNLVEALNWSDPNNTTVPNTGWGLVHIKDTNNDKLDDHWIARHQQNGTSLLAGGDPDGDLRTNLEESIVGSNPWVSDQPWMTPENPDPVTGPGTFNLTFRSLTTMRYQVEQSDDLLTWTENQQLWGDGSMKNLSIATGTVTSRFFRIGLVLTNGGNLDSDGDGLPDWYEINIFHTNPLDADSDNDGMPDGFEVAYGLNPSGNGDYQLDGDGDGIQNIDEFVYELDPRRDDFTAKASTVTFNSADRVQTVSFTSGMGFAYTYDAEGNLLTSN